MPPHTPATGPEPGPLGAGTPQSPERPGHRGGASAGRFADGQSRPTEGAAARFLSSALQRQIRPPGHSRPRPAALVPGFQKPSIQSRLNGTPRLLRYSNSSWVNFCSGGLRFLTKPSLLFGGAFGGSVLNAGRGDRKAKRVPPAPGDGWKERLPRPERSEGGGRLPGTGPPSSGSPSCPSCPAAAAGGGPGGEGSPAPSPATYGEAADGGALLRQGRVQGEAPPRPVLTGEHHHGGLHGAGRAGGSAALCPPRPAAAPFIRPRGD